MWRVFRYPVHLSYEQTYAREIGRYDLSNGQTMPRTRSTVNDEIKKWLAEHMPGQWRYRVRTRTIMFKNEDAALHFKLRWYTGAP